MRRYRHELAFDVEGLLRNYDRDDSVCFGDSVTRNRLGRRNRYHSCDSAVVVAGRDNAVIHTPLGKIEQLPSGKWLGYLEIGPRSDAEGPSWPIAQIEARTREQLMQRMLAEARFQMNLLGTMISWAENQEWARRKKR